MKGDKQRRKHGFQKGHVHHKSASQVSESSETRNNESLFRRLTVSEMESVNNIPFSQESNHGDSLHNSSPSHLRLLHPRADPPLEVEKNNESADWLR